jgi:hypothetical protein
MSRQCTAFIENMPSMTSQKLKIIRSLKSGESQREVMASYNMGSSAICEMKAPLTVISYIKSVKYLYK